MEAQQLPPLTYSELLFCATAMSEAQPLADAFAEAKTKEKSRADNQAKKPRSLAGTRPT